MLTPFPTGTFTAIGAVWVISDILAMLVLPAFTGFALSVSRDYSGIAFAIGVTLYEGLTGLLPFGGSVYTLPGGSALSAGSLNSLP